MITYELPQRMLQRSQVQYSVSATETSSFTLPEISMALFQVQTLSSARVFALAARTGTNTSPLDSEGFALACRQSFDEANTLASQWKKLVLDRSAPIHANALTATVKPLFRAMSRLGASAIDLRNLPTEQVNGVHLAVVLRTTLSFKERTPGWNEALHVARDALRRDGIDENDALIGLI